MEPLDRIRKDLVTMASLFTSFSTLLCCALPALLVTMGLGAVVAGVFSNIPGLGLIVRYHDLIFVIAGLLLALNGWLVLRPSRGEVCAPSQKGETACETAHRWNVWVFWLSVALFVIGVTVTYLAPALLIGEGEL